MAENPTIPYRFYFDMKNVSMFCMKNHKHPRNLHTQLLRNSNTTFSDFSACIEIVDAFYDECQ